MSRRNLALLIFSFALIAGCQKNSKNQEINPPRRGGGPTEQKPAPVTRALIFGDSLAYGFGAKSPDVTPAGCLKKITGAESVVRAVPGATTHDIVAQIKAATGETAAIVFLSAGGNDVLEDVLGSGFTAEESVRNFETIATELTARKIKVVYLLAQPPVESAARMARLGRMAETAGFLVFDGMKGFWGDKELMSDRLHPNDKGYATMCERLVTALKPKKD